MATTPFADQLAGRLVSTPTREINNEYHLELIAKNSETANTQRTALLRGQHALLRAQVEAATLNLRGQAEIARRQDCTNDLLAGLAGDMLALLGEAERMNEQLASIEDVLDVGFQKLNSTLTQGFASVVGVLERTVAVLNEQQQTLTDIAGTLRRPGDTEAQELLCEAQKWLEMGANGNGPEREVYWNDAMGLLLDVVTHKMGRQNFLAWFRIGFLHWKRGEALAEVEKQRNAFAEAEKGFSNAQLYSAPNRNLWHTKSLRHLAEMQYLQSKFEEAYATAHRAIAIQRQYETLYNTARYASKTGRKEEMVALLDECIELRPTTIITMFSEEDFQE